MSVNDIILDGLVNNKIACQVEMAGHIKALLTQLNIPTYHFHKPDDADAGRHPEPYLHVQETDRHSRRRELLERGLR